MVWVPKEFQWLSLLREGLWNTQMCVTEVLVGGNEKRTLLYEWRERHTYQI